MSKARVVRTVLALVLGAGALAAAPAGAQGLAPSGPPLVVTGQERPLGAYLRAGASLQQAALLAELDHLVAHGADRHLLTALAQTTAEEGAESSPTPQGFVELIAAGDLNGGGEDVLEVRVVPGKQTTTQLVAREGSSGRVLWQRTEQSAKGELVIPLAALVGAPPRPGILLYRRSFFEPGQVLTALDHRGRQVWRRSVSTPTAHESDEGLLSSSGWEVSITMITVDQRLRSAGPEVLLTQSSWSEDTSGPRPVSRGDLEFLAVSARDGSVRSIGPKVTSDGWVTGMPAGDQSGDGLTDLTLAVAGSKPRVAVVRGKDGSAVWNRTDIPTHGYAWMTTAQAWDVAPTGAPDLALYTGPDPGVVGPVSVPWVPFDPTGLTGVTVADPTAAEHGSVALLGRRSGATLWSRSGDDLFVPDRAGRSRVAVVTNRSTSTPSEYVVSAEVTMVDRQGKGLWTRSYTRRVPRGVDESASTYVAGWGLSDLDGDGMQEAVILLVLSTTSSERWDYHVWSTLVRGRDGSPLADQESGLLFGGVTRVGADRFRFAPDPSGLTLSVVRGRDSLVLFKRLLPGSKGVTGGHAVAAGPGLACSDVLYAGMGAKRAVLGVLASDGSPRWWVSGVTAELRPAPPVRPTRVPTPRC